MDSSKIPAPQQQKPADLFCDICDTQYNSLQGLVSHYDESKHIDTSQTWAKRVFGYGLRNPVTSLHNLFLHPMKRGTFIGLQYLKTVRKKRKGYNTWGGQLNFGYNTWGGRLNFSCILCSVTRHSLFEHLISMRHKRRYIAKHFSFLFEDVESISIEMIKNISMVIAKVEGFENFKVGVKNCNGKFLDFPGRSSTSENLPKQTLDRIVEQLQIHEITFKNPYGKGNEVPHLQTGSHASGTNEKKNINTSVPSKPSATSEITSRQVNDKIGCKPQIHGNEFKNACRKGNDVPSLQAGSRDFAINRKSANRPLGFTPLAEFKRRKTELPSQHAGEPIRSLSSMVPVPFSLADLSVIGFPHKNVYGHKSLQENKLLTTSYVPQVNKGMSPKPIPSLCSSHSEQWASETNLPPSGEYSLSWPPAVSFYENAKHEYGYSDQSLYEFANKSAYEQGSSVSDFGKANVFEGQTWGLEPVQLGAQHLHTLEATGGSIESLNVPSSSVASLKHDTPSLCGHNSLDSKELFSKSSSPSAINSVLNQQPSLSKSLGGNLPHEDSLPTSSTNSHAQTSQSTHSNMLSNALSMLPPHTLKILHGREPESVKSILKRLSEYCPELQQVNISLLVDVLFETGTLP